MAKIWAVYEGKEPTVGGPWATLPLADAVYLFKITINDFIAPIEKTPRLGDTTRNQQIWGYRHIIVEVARTEGLNAGLGPGFYKSPLSVKDGVKRLYLHAFQTVLGRENVRDVNYESTTDSRGRDAIVITAKITQKAEKKLRTKASLDVTVQLQHRLREMGDERTPIVRFTTTKSHADHADN